MSDLLLLPSTRYEPPSAPRDRRRAQAQGLNTIIEEQMGQRRAPRAQKEVSTPRQTETPKQSHFLNQTQLQRLDGQPSPRSTDHFRSRRNDMRIQAWLSPQSDHFPTPKGFPTPHGTHFLEAPVLPSSPSAYTTEDEGPAEYDAVEEDSMSESSSSNAWNTRSSVMTDSTEFDDMYDDNAQADHEPVPSRSSSLQRHSAIRGRNRESVGARRALPPITIPAPPSIQDEIDLKKMTSPVAPTPTLSATIPPAHVLWMQSQQDAEIPSAPPSLDGSLTSEQMAQMSAPPTPVIGSVDDDEDEDWSGVQLQPGALATLQALSGSEDGFDDEAHHQPEQVIEIPEGPAMEMQQNGLRLITGFNLQQQASNDSSPVHGTPAGLAKIEIPTPGGFFAELSPRTRRTWDKPKTSPELPPPTSTTAEQFYKLPWSADEAPALPLPPPPPRRPQQQVAPQPINSSFPVQHIVHTQMPIIGQGATPTTAIRIANTPRTQAYHNAPATAFRIANTPRAQGFANTPRTQTFTNTPRTAGFAVPGTGFFSPRLPPPPSSRAETFEPNATGEYSNADTDVIPTEIIQDHDPEYAQQQQAVALANLDRTETWLMAQNNYLRGIINPEVRPGQDSETGPSVPPKDDDEESCTEAEAAKKAEAEKTTPDATPNRKTVRFSEAVVKPDLPCKLPSGPNWHESAYYRAFQDYVIRSQRHDVFVHRVPRYEALQAQRVSLREAHRNQLLGKYQLSVVPQSAKKRQSANVVRGDDILVDDLDKIKREKEAEALEQMSAGLWHVAAARALNGGRLIKAPVEKKLMKLPNSGLTMQRDKARVLDLGGQAVCDWAWHVALQYPNAKVYTVTTKAVRQISNCNVRGPPNHRQVSVERLTRLPFDDDHFDLVSARELHSVLKFTGENGEDEWETCLSECMRVLKPGGYLDFTILDSDIMKAGPLGLAKSVEFGFTLKRLGYDPSPTKLFLSRLRRAGFTDARRHWMFLPVGAAPAATKPATASGPQNLRPNPDGSEVRTCQLDAMLTGSSDDIAPVTGLMGSLSWERWLLRCEMEKVAGALRLADTVTSGPAVVEAGKCLDGVQAVIEEGRRCGAGWRMLSGFARKPRPETEGIIRIQLC